MKWCNVHETDSEWQNVEDIWVKNLPWVSGFVRIQKSCDPVVGREGGGRQT